MKPAYHAPCLTLATETVALEANGICTPTYAHHSMKSGVEVQPADSLSAGASRIRAMQTVSEPSNGARCKGTNRKGEPCARRATDNGYCVAHSGRVDMAAIGAAGGRASVRSRLGLDPELADGRLRMKAKRRLEDMLDSDDERTALTAARSLYSYSPAQAPSDEDEPPAAGDVGALKVILRRLDALSTDQTRTLLDDEAFNLLNRVGRRDGELERAFENFTEQLAEVAARKQQHPRPET